jgi:hypothetical protein
MLRVAAMSFILRAGVVCTESEFRTVQARIDTVLYRRLSAAELKLFAALHKAVWVSAGRLKREQIYPVAYVIWQTMRLTCQRASHLQNLTTRSKCMFYFSTTNPGLRMLTCDKVTKAQLMPKMSSGWVIASTCCSQRTQLFFDRTRP